MSSDFHHRRWLIFFVLVLYMLIMQTSSPPLASVVCKFVTLVGRWSYSLHTGTTPPLLRKVGWPAQRKRHIVFCYSFGRTHPPKLSCFCSLSLSLHGFYGELSASLIPSFLYSCSTSSTTLFLEKCSSPTLCPSPPPCPNGTGGLSSSNIISFLIPAPSEPPATKIELYSPQYYAACTVGGILSCGLTHTAVTPLDIVKCNMQVWLPSLLSSIPQIKCNTPCCGPCLLNFLKYGVVSKFFFDLGRLPMPFLHWFLCLSPWNNRKL